MRKRKSLRNTMIDRKHNTCQMCLILLVFLTSVSDASYFEKKLLEDLFKNYQKDVRPVLNDKETVLVKMGLSLNQIMDVDEKNQIMTTSVWARQKWYNPYLRWNKSEYGNLTTINVISKNVWLPDMVLYNNADASIDFRGNLDRLSTRVQITNKGLNIWLSPVMLKSKCKINVEYFPFDSQTCEMKFGSWTYDGLRLDVRNESDRVDLMMYIESAEWRLKSAPVKRNVLYYFCCPQPYPDVTFYFVIQRRSLFYLTNLILPLIVISLLITFVFTLPPESGERISLSITILLAMTVFMLLVTETIPPTSEVVPLVAKFYMAAMFEIAMALVVTCYILRCYHFTGNEVPDWMKKYLVGKMANFLGVKKSKALLKEEREEESIRMLKKKAGFLESMMDKMEDMEEEVGRKKENGNCNETVNKGDKMMTEKLLNSCANHIKENGFQNGHQRSGEKPKSFYELLSKSETDNAKTDDSDHIGKMMLEKLDILSSSVQAKEKVDIVKEQWHIIAMVIDRLAMWTFAAAIFTTISIIFYQSPGYVS